MARLILVSVGGTTRASVQMTARANTDAFRRPSSPPGFFYQQGVGCCYAIIPPASAVALSSDYEQRHTLTGVATLAVAAHDRVPQSALAPIGGLHRTDLGGVS